jgi:IMP dehydrogenase
MDTVTESDMAIGMAKAGGMGVIHRNLVPAAQAKQVNRVLWEHRGLIETPITLPAETTISVFKTWKRDGDGSKFKFDTFPIVVGTKVVGLLTKRNLKFAANDEQKLADIMTPRAELTTAPPGTSREGAFQLMMEKRITILLLLDENDELRGMYLLSNLEQICSSGPRKYSLDERGQLITGVAVGVLNEALERAARAAERGCRVVQIDTAHGDTKNVAETVRVLRRQFPELCILAGNVAAPEGAARLAEAGANFVLVGVGPGSICTTRIVNGAGRAQLTAVYECARQLRGSGVGIIADGGIRYSGDAAKALAAGADLVMMGGMFAGTDEAPVEDDWSTGIRRKKYRGMGSEAAMQQRGSQDRYRHQTGVIVPQGVEGLVAVKGPVLGVVQQLQGGIQGSMGQVGARTLKEFREKAEFELLSSSGRTESHPHDLLEMKGARNYHA